MSQVQAKLPASVQRVVNADHISTTKLVDRLHTAYLGLRDLADGSGAAKLADVVKTLATHKQANSQGTYAHCGPRDARKDMMEVFRRMGNEVATAFPGQQHVQFRDAIGNAIRTVSDQLVAFLQPEGGPNSAPALRPTYDLPRPTVVSLPVNALPSAAASADMQAAPVADHKGVPDGEPPALVKFTEIRDRAGNASVYPAMQFAKGDLVVVDDGQKLGKGSYGSVTIGFWRPLGTQQLIPVAVKNMDPSNGAANFERIQEDVVKEATVMAALPEGTSIGMLDFGAHTASSTATVVLELASGDMAKNRAAFVGNGQTHRQAMANLLRDLSTMHKAGVFQKDIKDENVLLVRDKNGVRLKFADFGKSQRIDAVKDGWTAGHDMSAFATMMIETWFGHTVDQDAIKKGTYVPRSPGEAEMVDLARQMLDPEKCISMDQALNHPYVKGLQEAPLAAVGGLANLRDVSVVDQALADKARRTLTALDRASRAN